jgi:hypothetical protein
MACSLFSFPRQSLHFSHKDEESLGKETYDVMFVDAVTVFFSMMVIYVQQAKITNYLMVYFLFLKLNLMCFFCYVIFFFVILRFYFLFFEM